MVGSVVDSEVEAEGSEAEGAVAAEAEGSAAEAPVAAATEAAARGRTETRRIHQTQRRDT